MRQIGDITFYGVQEVARAFDMRPQSVRAYLKSGRIKGQKVGTRWFVTEEAIRDFLLGEDKTKEER